MIAVGISGGVDSAVAALLLKEQGNEVVGVTMTLGRADEEKSVAEAKSVAERLGIPLRVFDFSRAWKSCVLDYLRDTYLAGATPNPCVRCNETVKFGLLPRAAFELGCEKFATGHYARILIKHRDTETQSGGKNPVLLRAVDKAKDQSYFLYRVKPEILANTVFPLGGFTKDEVRAKARSFGLEAADKGDSQDFCGGDPMDIVGAAPREEMTFIPMNQKEDPYTFAPDMLGFIQKHRINWTGWCFHPKAAPVMIKSWDYDPTPYWGEFAKRALGGEKFELKKMR